VAGLHPAAADCDDHGGVRSPAGLWYRPGTAWGLLWLHGRRVGVQAGHQVLIWYPALDRVAAGCGQHDVSAPRRRRRERRDSSV